MFRAALILTLPALLVAAQARPRMMMPQGPMHRPALRPQLHRERVMAQLHRIRTARIQESLGVPEDKALAIANRWEKFDRDSMDRRQEMNRLRDQVNTTLVGPGTEEEKNAKLRPMMGQLTLMRQNQQEARRKFEEDICASLTPAQQGRFILLTEEFQKHLQEAIQDQRRDRGKE